jgi:Flp pilus assembly pilin Flp
LRTEWCRALARDESGQDIVEYVLLGSCLGFAAVAAVGLLGDAMGATYQSWDAAVQSDALVEVPDPVAGSSP